MAHTVDQKMLVRRGRMRSHAEAREEVLETMAYLKEPVRITDVAASMGRSEPYARKAIMDLLEQGIVMKQGAGKATRYILNEQISTNGTEKVQENSLPFHQQGRGV